jgi:primosomal protein N'
MSEPFGDITMKKCNNCDKPIEEPKFRLHEVTCARNNIKCHLCGEVISRADKDQHA